MSATYSFCQCCKKWVVEERMRVTKSEKYKRMFHPCGLICVKCKLKFKKALLKRKSSR